ncbi:insulinase family protein [Nocardioides sp. 616]|uniref:insulinase family protein n=1 Tax=Nocardioides sp. 616 TaxID=2268090 RepID=UPI0013B45570|nr:insulinase family protein [Nocardioides sp. 616]
MANVRRGKVGTVDAFWVENVRPTLAASLLFRQGIADETLPRRGWTHLLEHMALDGRGGGALEVNGSVSLLTCSFDLHGPADRVIQTLNDLTSWLTVPDLSDLEHERSVLRAEASLRGSGPLQEALSWRYGATGPGVAGYHEMGLSNAGPSELQELAGRCFASGNAALFLDGPPPPELELTLPEGEGRPAPAAVPLRLPHLGSYPVHAPGGVISGVVPRSRASQLFASVLNEHLMVALRREAAGAYAPWCTYEPVDETTAVVLAGSDANTELLPRLVSLMVAELRRIVDEGPPENVLAGLQERVLQQIDDPFAVAVPARLSAQLHLRGLEPTSRAHLAEELRAVTADMVRSSARAMLRTVLVGVPAESERVNGSRELEMPLRDRFDGTVHRAQGWPADDSRLILGPQTLAIGQGEDFRAADTHQLAALLRIEDGGRVLVRRDGWSVTLEPTLWKGGTAVVDRVDLMVPAALHVTLPPRDPDAIPAPPPVHARWRHVRRLVVVELVLLGLILLCLAGGAALINAALQHPDPPPVIIVLWLDAVLIAGLAGTMWGLLRER